MKRLIYILLILFSVYNSYAQNKLKDYFKFELCSYTEKEIDNHGWLEHVKLTDTDYSECLYIKVEDLAETSYLLYYPIGYNEKNQQEAVFEILNQKFVFYNSVFDYNDLQIVSLPFNEKNYLIIMGAFDKYGDKICFIFDITNPDNIKFYPPEERFIEAEMLNNFVGEFQNKLCFFFSSRRYDWNGQYQLIPYYIEGDSLKELCDENGNSYFVNYSYIKKSKQEYIVEDKNIPAVK